MKKVKGVSIVLACLMALVFVSCEDSVSGANDGGGPEAALNGTWVHRNAWGEEEILIFNNGNFEILNNGLPAQMGTYTISGNYLIIRTTHIHGAGGLGVSDGNYGTIDILLGSRWYSRSELISVIENRLQSAGVPSWSIADTIWHIEHFFGPRTVIFTLSGNVLSITSHGETTTYTRRN